MVQRYKAGQEAHSEETAPTDGSLCAKQAERLRERLEWLKAAGA